MKETVNFNRFCDMFAVMNRNDNFSHKAKQTLFDYINEWEEETGEETELDIIAICCAYSEYENLDDFQLDYGDNYQSVEDISEHTTVIKIDGTDGFIVESF